MEEFFYRFASRVYASISWAFLLDELAESALFTTLEESASLTMPGCKLFQSESKLRFICAFNSSKFASECHQKVYHWTSRGLHCSHCHSGNQVDVCR